jgi:hypothetical protein
MFVHDTVVATLTELGLPAQSDCIQTMLIRNRRFAGHKFSYDEGYAVLRCGGQTLELYDNGHKLLKKVSVGTENERGTAA